MIIEMVTRTDKGYWIIVKQFKGGWRAAYVGIPFTDRLYGKDEEWPAIRQFNTILGRVNYAADRVGGWEGHPRNDRRWWFGLDNFEQDSPTCPMTQAYVAALQLARQLAEYEVEHGVW